MASGITLKCLHTQYEPSVCHIVIILWAKLTGRPLSVIVMISWGNVNRETKRKDARKIPTIIPQLALIAILGIPAL